MEQLTLAQIHQLIGELVYANRQIAILNADLKDTLTELREKVEELKARKDEVPS